MKSKANQLFPVKDIIEWDVKNWSMALPFWEQYLPAPTPDIKILTLGEREGGLALWLAMKGYNVIYSDIHDVLPSTLNLHHRYKVEKSVTYAKVNVFHIPYESDFFDIIICKSTLGGIKLDQSNKRTRTLQNQKLACEEIRRTLKPGGVFLGAENALGSRLHQFWRTKRNKNKYWRYLSQPDIKYMFENYAQLAKDSFGYIPTSSSIEILNSTALKINHLLKRIISNEMLYITFIAAQK